MGKGFYFTFEAVLFLLAVLLLSFSWPKIIPSDVIAYESTQMLCDDLLVVLTTSSQDPVIVIESITKSLQPNSFISFSRDKKIILSRDVSFSSHVSCEASFWNGSSVERFVITLGVFA